MKRLILLILVLLIAVPALAQDTGSVQTIRPHWSPYTYPTEFPEGARGYLIKDGDTLWDIANQFYGNPLLWPHIHEANPYIKDPDLIYPDDPLVLPDLAVAEPGRMTATQELPTGEADTTGAQQQQPLQQGEDAEAAAQEQGGQPGAAAEGGETTAAETNFQFDQGVIFETQPRKSLKYEPTAREMDLYCAPMVYRDKLDTELVINGREDDGQIEIQPGDIVYINKGEGYLNAGEYYTALNMYEEVTHPVFNSFVGHYYQEVGIIRIILVCPEHSVAEVIMGCDGLRVGSNLIPFENHNNPVNMVRERLTLEEKYRECDYEEICYIVLIPYGGLTAAPSDLAVIDKGSEDGLIVGERIEFVKDSPLYKVAPNSHYRAMQRKSGKFVSRIYGEAIVIRLTQTTATIKLTYSDEVVMLGQGAMPAEPIALAARPEPIP